MPGRNGWKPALCLVEREENHRNRAWAPWSGVVERREIKIEKEAALLDTSSFSTGRTRGHGLKVARTYTKHMDAAFDKVDEFRSSHLLVELLEVVEQGLWVKRPGKNIVPTPYLVPWSRILFIKPSDPPSG